MYQTIRELEPYRPSFVSVTYGAGGSTRELTREVVLRIQHESRIPTVPHLTCVGHSREEYGIFWINTPRQECGLFLHSGETLPGERRITTVMRMFSVMRRIW